MIASHSVLRSILCISTILLAGAAQSSDQASDNGDGSLKMRGYGTVTKGGPLTGRITSKNGKTYSVILSAAKDGFTCSGSFDERPGGSDSISTAIHCTDGSTGSVILKGKLMSFSAGGKSGIVTFR